jgi:flagellar hook-associated protein 2
MPIISSGIGSGLDISGIVSQLMAVERLPLAKLDQKEAAYQAKISAYGSFKGSLSAFQSSMKGLSTLSKFQGRKASSADSTIFTAAANTKAVAGSYAVEVTQLAQAQKLTSGGFDASSSSVGTGTLTIQFGTWDGVEFVANPDKTAENITIDSDHSTLAGVRDAINDADAGVTATIVNDGTDFRLLITSNDTGEANSLKITVSDSSDASNTDNAGLSQLAYDPAGSLGNGMNLDETVAAQNAMLNVDGIVGIEKAGNIITDVIEGVTLTLLKESDAGDTTTLTVSQDTAVVKTAVEEFVKAYNDLNIAMRSVTGYDPATKQGGILQGDSAVLTTMSQIRRVLGGSLGLSNGYSNLSQVGISFEKDGSLSLDGGKLTEAMNDDFDAIAGLFASFGTSSDPQIRYVSATDSARPGSYSISVTQQATRGYRNGDSTAALADTLVAGTFDTPFVIDSNNDVFSVMIDETQSSDITLTQGTYTTTAALAAEIQSKINADSALKSAGAKVTVTFDSTNDRFVITSNRYGSNSKVEIATVDLNMAVELGLTVAASTVEGLDVVGSFDGAEGTGDGQFLTAPPGSNAYGLKVDVDGGTNAVLRFSRGFAYQLNQLVDGMLEDNGALDSRVDGLRASIDDIGDRRDSLNRRLEQTEARIRAQFVALDGLIAQLRQTSDYLSQQLSRLPGANTQGNR